jgi:NADH-quinone oxidoreductase subunit N
VSPFSTDFGRIVPELFVTATILCVLLSEVLFGGDDEYEEMRVSDFVALVGLLMVLAVTLLDFKATLHAGQAARSVFSGTLSIDPFSQFVKLLLLLSALFAVLFSYQTPEVCTPRRAEYVAYLLTLLLGGMLLASANDILMLYLAFETLGVCSYILAGHVRGSLRSTEAGFKYVLYGAASSGLLLYGLSFLYGMAGTTHMPLIFQKMGALAAQELFPGGATAGDMVREVSLHVLPAPFFMILAGLLYKVGVFPFHFWVPDVYEGAPMPVTAAFSVLVKIAGFSAFLRFLYGYALGLMNEVSTYTLGQGQVSFLDLSTVLGVLAAITMTVGNFSALNQNNIKRLLAYSGIANAGYVLMGACVLVTRTESHYDVEGVFAVLFFLAVYMFANVGAFVVAIAVADHLGKEEIDDYAGLGRLVPVMGVAMTIFLFSLIGLPPLAGFIGKFYLFYAVVHCKLWWLAVIGVLNSVVSLFYYARVLKLMLLAEPPPGTVCDISSHYKALLWMLMVPVVGLGVSFGRP